MKRFFLKISLICLIASFIVYSFSFVSTSLAYFHDTEISQEDTFEAGVLGFSLGSGSNFLPELANDQTTCSRTINLTNDGSLEFQYNIEAKNLTGELCNYLSIKDNLAGSFTPLVDYTYETALYPATDDITFTVQSSSYDESLQGKKCDFDIALKAWQKNLPDDTEGFTDQETISNTVNMAYWDSPVVLNEFLPNASNYPEFVEIYNQTASPLDLSGYYIDTGEDVINITSVTTAEFSGGKTVIPGNGWLVVSSNDDKLNDSSGEIVLYNENDIVVDSYIYAGPEHNINNTPADTNNLAGYWSFDENLEDQSGNGNNGSFHDNAQIVSSGKINGALALDGNNDYVEIPDSDSLDITDSITLEAWVYSRSWDNSHENAILTKAGNSSYGAWNLHHKTTSNGFRFEINNGSPHPLFENNPSVNLNTWYHIIGTYDGSNMKIYVNGNMAGSKPLVTTISTNNEPLRIGKQFWCCSTYSYWDGSIDEVKIYDRALSADEVEEHYEDVGDEIGEVPVDKSYARIPDGSDNWIDPVPTPGGVNRTENQIMSLNKNKISLNEVLVKPSNLIKEGQWIELYNDDENYRDLAGWYIRDEENNTVFINSENTDKETTVIDGKGYLVLHLKRNILNINSDTISLYNNGNFLLESYSYEQAAIGKSYSKKQNTCTWQETQTTLGEKNEFEKLPEDNKIDNPETNTATSSTDEAIEDPNESEDILNLGNTTTTALESEKKQNKEEATSTPEIAELDLENNTTTVINSTSTVSNSNQQDIKTEENIQDKIPNSDNTNSEVINKKDTNNINLLDLENNSTTSLNLKKDEEQLPGEEKNVQNVKQDNSDN